jgi:hypothetical protein
VLEFARLQRWLHGRDRPRQRLLLPYAIAASVLIAGLAGLLFQRTYRAPPATAEWDGAKGTGAREFQVRLRAVRLGTAGVPAEVRPGDALDRTESLLFEVEASRGTDAVLARLPPEGGVELLWRSRLAAGRTVVTAGGRPAAQPLAGLGGPQRFAVFASDGGLDEPRVEAAAAALARAGGLQVEPPALQGVAFDVLEISVR